MAAERTHRDKYGLTPMQRAFADYYIETGNGKQSAIRAGYAAGSAYVTGSRLLDNHKIRAYIDARMQEMAQGRVLSAQEVLEQLSDIAAGRAVQRLTDDDEGRKPTIQERTKALELLGKRHALWVDRQDVTGVHDVQIDLSRLTDEEIRELAGEE